MIQPKQQIPISFSFCPTQGPLIDEIFVCEVEDLELPLGIQLTSKVAA